MILTDTLHERELETIYKRCDFGIGMLDLGLRFFRINRRFADLHQRSVADFNGATVRQVLPRLADRAERILKKIRSSQKPVWDGEYGRAFQILTGSPGRLSGIWLPIKDDNGQMIGIILMVLEADTCDSGAAPSNVTLGDCEPLAQAYSQDLERHINALQEKVLELGRLSGALQVSSRVLSDSTDPIIIEDMQHTIIEANRAAETTYGYSRQELLGRPITILIPKKRHCYAKLIRRRCIKGEIIHDYEGWRVARGGTLQPTLITAFMTRNQDDRSKAIVTIAKDISPMKSMPRDIRHRAKKMSRWVNEMVVAEHQERRGLAGEFHDNLQQPLAGAKRLMESMAENHELTADPYYNAARELIQTSLLTARQLAPQISPGILFEQGLGRALKWLGRKMHRDYGLTVSLTLAENIEPETEEQKILLYESVRELLLPIARDKATNVAVTVTGKEGWLQIVIHLPAQGDRGRPAWDHNTRMFFVNERLRWLGGTMDLKYSDMTGAVITLTCPKAENRSLTSGPDLVGHRPVTEERDPPINPRGIADGDKIRVMLVDDHAVMRDGLSAMLSRQTDIEVAGEASNGVDAITMARKIQPDVILMDINMPHIDGIEATRRIHAEQRQIQIIGLSMHEIDDQGDLIRDAGAVDYLNKTGSSGALLKAIRTAADCTERM